MKTLKKILSVWLIFSAFSSKATHIVGGDITVKWVSGNNFEVTLTFYRDCNPGNAAYDAFITLGVYDKTTQAQQQTFQMNLGTVTQLSLGDTCYTPPNLCVEKAIYQTTITLPNNPNGYYIIWHRCCRNSLITNIVVPLKSGYVFYSEVPDPALKNSTPVFSSYPDAYMCQGYPNIDNFSATDKDGDSLVYSLTVPLDCDPTTNCSINPIPPPSSGPYGTITWSGSYSLANILGDPTMAVNPQTGILTTTPPAQGVFVFCVRVQEYRAGVKIGEVRRDVQYAVLPCVIPTVFISGPNPICLGQSTTLTAAGGQNYTWNTGATTISIVITPTAIGTYTFSAVTTVNSNCHISADTAITVNPAPVATAVTADDTICIGTNTTLTATGGGPYLWSPGGQTTNTAIVAPVVNTTYTVLITNNFGCTSTASVKVVPVPAPAITTSPPAVLCLGDSTQLIANSTLSNVTYSWVPGTGLNCTSCPNPVANPSSSSTYTVYVSTGNGCANTATTSVTVNAMPFVSAVTNSAICTGNSASLNAITSNGALPYTYYWSPSGTLNNPNISNPVASPTVATTYTVNITDANGCRNADTVLVLIGIEPQALFISSSALSCDGIYVQFTDSSIDAVSWYWIFGDNTTSTQQNAEHLFPYDNSSYSVTLVVTNPPCQDSLEKVIFTGSFFTIASANVFTPNGDGINDCFHPVFIGLSSDSLAYCVRLEIFDRWGVKMFESDGAKTCWDGTNRNNKQIVNGTYYYMAELGETRIKGFVEVMK